MSTESKPKYWLITAFDPFAGRPTNNSKLVLEEMKKIEEELLQDTTWPFQFFYHVLPVEYDTCYTALTEHINLLIDDGIKLEGILSIGEGSEEFKLETQANNLDDVAEISDNLGVKRISQKIFKDLSVNDVIPLRFPFEAFSRIRKSTSPGYFVCNHLCAKMAHELAPNPLAPYFGFIHVPKTGQGGLFTADVCARVILSGFRTLSQSEGVKSS